MTCMKKSCKALAHFHGFPLSAATAFEGSIFRYFSNFGLITAVDLCHFALCCPVGSPAQHAGELLRPG